MALHRKGRWLVAAATVGALALAGLTVPRLIDANRTPPPQASAAPIVNFPTEHSVGVPADWVPSRSISGDYRVTSAGDVVEDLRITGGTLLVDAPDVTVRRVEIIDGSINAAPRGACSNGLVIEDTTIRSEGATNDRQPPAVGPGGYTARRVLIDGVPEGFRAGQSDSCGDVRIEHTFVRVTPPSSCADWHGDALQGYGAPRVHIVDSTMVLVERPDCTGTAAFFYPSDQSNTSVDIDGLLVQGGGYPFRLGTPGTVRGLRVVDGSWGFGPIDVRCSSLSAWDAEIVLMNKDQQPISRRELACDTEGG